MGELGQASGSLPCAVKEMECRFCDDEAEEADVETRKQEKEKTKTRLEQKRILHVGTGESESEEEIEPPGRIDYGDRSTELLEGQKRP